jgi:hypothetical protein
MKNFSLLLNSAALGAALVSSSPVHAAAQSASGSRGSMFTGRSAEVGAPAVRCYPGRPYWMGPYPVATWTNEWWWRHHGWGWGGYGALYALGLGGIGADYPYWDYYPQDYYDNAWGSPYYYQYTYAAVPAPPGVACRQDPRRRR